MGVAWSTEKFFAVSFCGYTLPETFAKEESLPVGGKQK
jgi:hypothetical protein